MQPLLQPDETADSTSKDGLGAGDHDVPFNFGRKPCSSAPWPFSTRQYVRLLIVRSRVQAGEFAWDNLPAM